MKRLIFRLSSLGDVILAHSALESPYSGETHWVVAREFESLLLGNPRIQRVWAFDRKKDRRLKAWVDLLRKLHAEGFTEVIDLHSTLRTRIAHFYFKFWDLRSKNKGATWRRISKSRSRRLAYILLKHFLPRSLRPISLTSESARLAGGSGLERPNLKWLIRRETTVGPASSTRYGGKNLGLQNAWSNGEAISGEALASENSIKGKMPAPERGVALGIAPSSAWRQKEWSAEKYFQLITELQFYFSSGDLKSSAKVRSASDSQSSAALQSVYPGQLQICLFGTSNDQTSVQLRDALMARGVSFVDYVGKLALPEVANALSKCDFVLGADTGLVHLAEAVGVPVIVLYGPTQSDFGFGPSRPDSVAVHGPVRCSPCSKDGTLCYRLGDRYACLRKMRVETVREAVLFFVKNKALTTDKGQGATSESRESEKAKPAPFVKSSSQKGTQS